jgi:hypothetical protein
LDGFYKCRPMCYYCVVSVFTRNAYIKFYPGNMKGRHRLLRDISIHGREILKMYLKEIRCAGMDRIKLAHDWNQWRDVANTVMKLPMP